MNKSKLYGKWSLLKNWQKYYLTSCAIDKDWKSYWSFKAKCIYYLNNDTNKKK